MASPTLHELLALLQDDLDGVAETEDRLELIADVRYGQVQVFIEHDEDAESIRVSAPVPPPAGAGRRFLVLCLSLNVRYWDVKVGLDDDGQLLLHGDMDVGGWDDLDSLATEVLTRVESVLDLLDEDIVEWLLEHDLGTPAQRERWSTRTDDEEDEEDEEAQADVA